MECPKWTIHLLAKSYSLSVHQAGAMLTTAQRIATYLAFIQGFPWTYTLSDISSDHCWVRESVCHTLVLAHMWTIVKANLPALKNLSTNRKSALSGSDVPRHSCTCVWSTNACIRQDDRTDRSAKSQSLHQCCRFSRNIAQVASLRSNIYFCYQKIYL